MQAFVKSLVQMLHEVLHVGKFTCCKQWFLLSYVQTARLIWRLSWKEADEDCSVIRVPEPVLYENP